MLMRSIDEIRALLGPLAEGKTDEQLVELRFRAYDLARSIVERYEAQRRPARARVVRRPRRSR